MRFVSIADTSKYLLSGVPARRDIAEAIKNYISIIVAKEEIMHLKGLGVTIQNLDVPEIMIGGGIVGKEEAPYKIARARVEMMVTDIKKQLIIGERYPEDYKPEDVTDIDRIIKYGDSWEVSAAAAIKKFVNVAAKRNVNIPYSMRDRVNKMALRIESATLNISTCALYNSSWFKGFVDRRVASSNDGLKDNEKALVKAVIPVCEKFEALGYKNVSNLIELNNGLCVKAYGIKYMSGTRAATKSEIAKHVGNLFVGSANMLEDPDMFRWELFMLLMTGSSNIKYTLEKLKDSEKIKAFGDKWFCCFNKSESNESMITRCATTITDRISEIEALAENYSSLLKVGLSSLVYPDEPDIRGVYIIAASYTLEEMFTAIAENKPDDKYNDLAYKIATECLKNKKFDISEKQLDVLTRAYNKIKSGEALGLRVDTAEAVRIANTLISKYGDKLNKTVRSIAKDTSAKGTCSVKQFDVIKRALEAYESSGASITGGEMSVENVASRMFDSSKVQATDVEGSENKTAEGAMPSPMIPKPVIGVGDTTEDGSVDDLFKQMFS